MRTIASIDEYLRIATCGGGEAKALLRELSASADLWLRIIGEHPELKRAVTLNRNLPDAVLSQLARDPDPLVRTDVAAKRALPEGLFEALGRDEDETVRSAVSWNRRTPMVVLKRLAADMAAVVAEPARRRLEERRASKATGSTLGL